MKWHWIAIPLPGKRAIQISTGITEPGEWDLWLDWAWVDSDTLDSCLYLGRIALAITYHRR